MSNRARRAGDQFEIERKLEKRYESEEKMGTPVRLIEWINDVLAGQVQECTSADWQAVQGFLRDGVVLCKLINKLLAANGQPTVKYRPKAAATFVALNNIEEFINAAKEYGVPETAGFHSHDLFEGRKGQLLAVINCLNALGCVANAKGFYPHYEVPEAPKADWATEGN